MFALLLIAFVISIGLCAAVGHIAKGRGRSMLAWFGISILITPLFSLLLLLASKNIQEEKNREREKNDLARILHSHNANTERWQGIRSLNDDAYKIFLTKKYNLEKNDVLGKIASKNKLYDSVDEAIADLHEIDKKILKQIPNFNRFPQAHPITLMHPSKIHRKNGYFQESHSPSLLLQQVFYTSKKMKMTIHASPTINEV